MLHLPSKRALVMGQAGDIFRDDFNGSAINTNRWTVTDSESKVSVAGGKVSVSGGLASPAYGDPRLARTLSFFRSHGLTLQVEVTRTWTGAEDGPHVGFADAVDASNDNVGGVYFVGDGLAYASPAGSNIGVGISVATATSVLIRIVLKTAGRLYYLSDDGGVTWTLLWEDADDTTSPVFIMTGTYDAIYSHNLVRVFHTIPKPPLVSTTVSITPTLGAELVVNGTFAVDANWSKGAGWAIGGGTANSTSTSDLTQNLTIAINKFLQASWDVSDLVGDSHVRPIFGSAAGYGTDCVADGSYSEIVTNFAGDTTLYFRSLGADATLSLDNVSVKNITLASTLALAGDPGTREGIFDGHPTLTAGTQCGIAIGVDDETNPLYGVFAYHNGTNAILEKLVNGTWTALISAAATYSAGAQLRVASVGNSWGLYYNGAKIGATQTIDTSAFGVKFCGFSTLAANTCGTLTAQGGING